MGRLFVRLFVTLWVAMMASFGAGMTYLTLTGHGSIEKDWNGPRLFVMQRTVEQLLADGQLAAAIPLITRWNDVNHEPTIGLEDAAGRPLAGPPVGTMPYVQTVSVGGKVTYRLGSFIKPVREKEGPPPVAVPMVSGGLVALVFSSILAWRMSRRLRRLRDALRGVAQGDFSVRLGHGFGSGRDEVVDMANEFDHMAAQLQSLEQGRQRLLHDLSHELRSPLNRMRAAIGLYRQDPGDGERLIDRIERDALKIDALVDEVLTLARLEVGHDHISRERVDLIELLAAIADDAAFEAEARGGTVNLTTDGPFVSTVSGELICRAFENVIRNAVRYTNLGTAVEIQAKTDPARRHLQISVCDRGPGLPSDMLERMFEPFVRGEDPQHLNGFGLGLAIARRAVESHGGTVHAKVNGDGGLTVVIDLPASDISAPVP